LLDTIAKKKPELANARINYERSQKLLEAGLIARNDADRDRTAYGFNRRSFRKPKGKLKVLEDRRIGAGYQEQGIGLRPIVNSGYFWRDRARKYTGVESQVKKAGRKAIYPLNVKLSF